ncbi:IclR family transcriptional regulator [Salinarchaeum sp. IM2453]|uniref:IclR family transcriptional regulator n=1 Tax=Salinarchaeum sp. IM2453 TaxID=2862870 RepID=UPI001C828928|nr:IclR family transcriptional regulator [Salinarchaeum sp. IM2453]QZA88557.1 IclR family transcriptional regulator [Salinarchaeum sp. IM2453]
MTKKSISSAKTTERSIEIIEALMDIEGGSLDELSEYMGLASSTVHRHLAALQKSGYVVKDGTNYKIGLQFLTVGGHAQRQYEHFHTYKKKVEEIAEETGERAQFIVEEQGERVYLYTDVGSSAVHTGAQAGRRGLLHVSAGGKAILSQLPNSRIEKIIKKHGLPKRGKNSITSKKELFNELEQIRDQGYAVNRQETTNGVHAIGAPVTDDNQVVIGALSVSGPATRLQNRYLNEELPEIILSAVNEIELDIRHSP